MSKTQRIGVSGFVTANSGVGLWLVGVWSYGHGFAKPWSLLEGVSAQALECDGPSSNPGFTTC